MNDYYKLKGTDECINVILTPRGYSKAFRKRKDWTREMLITEIVELEHVRDYLMNVIGKMYVQSKGNKENEK